LVDYQGLMSDHFSDAYNYLCASRKILENIDINSSEYLFKMEGPVNHLLGLSMEHLLKSIYIRLHGKSFGHDHDLSAIKLKCLQEDVLNDDFIFWVDYASKDYKAHNFRYQRCFKGLPDDYDFNVKDVAKNKKELGLVVRSPVNPEKCIDAIETQWRKELEIQRPVKEKQNDETKTNFSR